MKSDTRQRYPDRSSQIPKARSVQADQQRIPVEVIPLAAVPKSVLKNARHRRRKGDPKARRASDEPPATCDQACSTEPTNVIIPGSPVSYCSRVQSNRTAAAEPKTARALQSIVCHMRHLPTNCV